MTTLPRSNDCAPPASVPLLSQLGADLATIAIRHGAPLASRCIDALPTGHTRDELIVTAVSVLRALGRDGLASQLAAFRFVEPVRVAS